MFYSFFVGFHGHSCIETQHDHKAFCLWSHRLAWTCRHLCLDKAGNWKRMGELSVSEKIWWNVGKFWEDFGNVGNCLPNVGTCWDMFGKRNLNLGETLDWLPLAWSWSFPFAHHCGHGRHHHGHLRSRIVGGVSICFDPPKKTHPTDWQNHSAKPSTLP